MKSIFTPEFTKAIQAGLRTDKRLALVMECMTPGEPQHAGTQWKLSAEGFHSKATQTELVSNRDLVAVPAYKLDQLDYRARVVRALRDRAADLVETAEVSFDPIAQRDSAFFMTLAAELAA
jgi:hypothetical protein